jgi:excisionase family DNA binding protein
MVVVKLYSPDEAAEHLGVTANTVRAWLRDGNIKGIKLGGRIWRISEEALNDFINASETEREGGSCVRAIKDEL